MESLATRSPKRLVIPRSSSFTGDPPCLRAARPPRPHHVVRRSDVPRGAPAAPVLPCGTSSLRLARRGDLDGAGDDVLLDLVELGLQLVRDLAVEVVERGQPRAAVLQRADVVALREVAGRGLCDVLLDRTGEVLGHRRQEVLAVLRDALAAVGVDPHHRELTARGGRGGRRADTGTTGNRENDIGALLLELLGDLLALVGVGERVGERAALLVHLVPA